MVPLYPALQMKQISSFNAVLELLLFVLCREKEFLGRGTKDLSDGWPAERGYFAAILLLSILLCFLLGSLLNFLRSLRLWSQISQVFSIILLLLAQFYLFGHSDTEWIMILCWKQVNIVKDWTTRILENVTLWNYVIDIL